MARPKIQKKNNKKVVKAEVKKVVVPVARKKTARVPVKKVAAKKKKNRKIGLLDRKDRVIAAASKKDVWRRQGTRRIKGGALDIVDGYLKQWVTNVISKAMASAVDGRRRTIKGKDVDLAFATEGTAIY